MHYNITYNVCAIVLLIIILLTHIAKKKMKSMQNSLYTVLICVSLGGALTKIADVLGIMYYETTPAWLKYTTSYCCYTLQGLFFFIFALYIMILLERTISELGIIDKICMTTPIIVQFLLLLTNPFTRALFYYDDNGIYHQGACQFLAYIVIIFYIIYIAVYCAALKDVLSAKMQLTIAFCMIGIGLSGIIQLFFPDQLVVYFGVALAILTIFLNIQKPEEYLDMVTGVFNSISFEKSFMLNSRFLHKNHLIMLYIEDVAILKQSIGIESTNQILKEIAECLEQIFPRNVYFLGGEIFGIMVRCEDERHILDAVRTLDEIFSGRWKYGNGFTDITVRIMEVRLPEDAMNLETIYSYEDYLRALDSNRKWILYARTVDMQHIQRKTEIESALRKAIERESFEIYYQPIYCVDEESITTAEALARLYDDELGNISPAEFIPIAEKNGMILQIGDIIFRKVFSFVKESDLQRKGLRYIEINLSMIQCMQENFAEHLTGIMKEYGIDSSRINLEVTETAAVNSPRRLRENMQELYGHGIRFSLDDFGTGYSNIDSLMGLPLDMIKIDKSMVDMAGLNDKGKIVLGSAIAMVKRMSMKIVAEGIETRAQKEYLESLGVDYLQGYYFSKPIPEEEFVKFIEHFNIPVK